MNIWLKIAIALVAALAAIIVIVSVLPKNQPPKPEKTYYDVIKEDDARLRAEPNVKETVKSVPMSKVTPIAPVNQPSQAATPQQIKPPPTIDVSKLVFKSLEPDEELEADKFLEMAITERKLGRLPVLSYGNTVNYCREIIQRFPGSKQDFMARRILADIPEQYRNQYKITAEEIDLTKWPKQ
jgi:hypothetical protein